MTAVQALRMAIARCGREVSITHGGAEYRFIAALQPRSYDTQMLTKDGQSRGGRVDPRQFVYYGPLENGGQWVEEGTVLSCADGQYRISLCHDFYCRETPAFRWAVARKLEGGA